MKTALELKTTSKLQRKIKIISKISPTANRKEKRKMNTTSKMILASLIKRTLKLKKPSEVKTMLKSKMT